jgi:hypothetical protein
MGRRREDGGKKHRSKRSKSKNKSSTSKTRAQKQEQEEQAEEEEEDNKEEDNKEERKDAELPTHPHGPQHSPVQPRHLTAQPNITTHSPIPTRLARFRASDSRRIHALLRALRGVTLRVERFTRWLCTTCREPCL